jgi:hypothetical protein
MFLFVAVLACAQVPDAGKKLVRQLAAAPALTAAKPKPPRELIPVEGTPGLSAFIDKDQVGLHDGKRLWAWTLPARLEGEVKQAFTVPGRPDQFIACTGDREPAGKSGCVWLAPKCGAAVLLTERFTRVEATPDAGLTARVSAHPACLIDGPEPRWVDDGDSRGVLAGTLETHSCAPPTWSHANLESNLPRCDGG